MFWLIRSIGRGSNRRTARAPRPKRTKAGPVAYIAIIAAAVFTVGTSMATGHLPGTAAMVLIPVILGVLILGRVIAAGVRTAERGARAIRDLPTMPTAADETAETALMRAQAAGFKFDGDTATLELPRPPILRRSPTAPSSDSNERDGRRSPI